MPRPARSTHPLAIVGSSNRRRLKADAGAAAERFVRTPPLSLHVMATPFSRAFHARSLETGAEGVVLVGEPVRPAGVRS